MTDKSLQSPYLLRLRPYVSGGQVPTQPPSLLIGRCLHHPPLQSTPPSSPPSFDRYTGHRQRRPERKRKHVTTSAHISVRLLRNPMPVVVTKRKT